MPITANALAHLGVHVHCIGALGYPVPHPVFNSLHSNCNHFSFADPGTCTAFEFNDGKIFFGEMGQLNTSGWPEIKNIIGIDTLINLYKESDLLCIVNWSEIDQSTGIWKGLLNDVLPAYNHTGTLQTAFFDLSDFSKRESSSVLEAISLLHEFSKFTRVILSLNRNEAKLIHQILFGSPTPSDPVIMGQNIYGKLGIDTLLLHGSQEAIAYRLGKTSFCSSFFVPEPKISTGAGDHFNAGFCAAQLLEFNLDYSLIFASAVAGYYIQSAQTPVLSDLAGFLKK